MMAFTLTCFPQTEQREEAQKKNAKEINSIGALNLSDLNNKNLKKLKNEKELLNQDVTPKGTFYIEPGECTPWQSTSHTVSFPCDQIVAGIVYYGTFDLFPEATLYLETDNVYYNYPYFSCDYRICAPSNAPDGSYHIDVLFIFALSGNPVDYYTESHWVYIEGDCSIDVTNPVNGDEYFIGSSIPVSWDSENCSGNVSIKLYQGSSLTTTIASSTSDDGYFLWNIPSSIQPANYRIKVTSLSEPTCYSYSGYFAISQQYFEPPTDLTAQIINQNDVLLNWVEPETGFNPTWINYDDGTNYTAIGTNGAADFDVAARFTSSSLSDYTGGYLTKVKFYPKESNCTYYIRVWTGGSGGNAGTLVVNQYVSNPAIDSWNTITLSNPVLIESGQELWFGYRSNTQTGHPAGCDDGPAINNYGNMIYWDGEWSNLLELNSTLDYNWNIQGYVSPDAKGKGNILIPITINEDRINNSGKIESGQVNSLIQKEDIISKPEPKEKSLLGYNIYRNSVKINSYPISSTSFTDEDLSSGTYQYEVTAKYSDGESDPTNLEEVTIYFTGIENLSEEQIKIYPSPAETEINIEANTLINSITIIDICGKIIYSECPKRDKIKVNVSKFIKGLYFVRLQTENKTISRKIMVK